MGIWWLRKIQIRPSKKGYTYLYIRQWYQGSPRPPPPKKKGGGGETQAQAPPVVSGRPRGTPRKGKKNLAPEAPIFFLF